MNILITGSTGLLGYEVMRHLKGGHQITQLVREMPQHPAVGVRYICCDLAEDFDFTAWPKDIDVIVHLAQSPFYRDFPERVDHVFKVNVAATAKLLDYARQSNVKQFIFTSTGSVYEPYHADMLENAQLNPSSFYANTKWMAERLFPAYQSYFNVSILRLFFLYGPHPNTRQTLINNLMQRLSQGQAITLDGADGEGLVFVPTLTTDIARCIGHVIDKELGGTFNLANPVSMSMASVVAAIANHLGVTPVIHRQIDKKAASIVPRIEAMLDAFDAIEFTSFADGIRMLSQ